MPNSEACPILARGLADLEPVDVPKLLERIQTIRTDLILSTSVVILLSVLATTGDAQPPIRIGASLSQTGAFAALGQNQLRGYQLCVKHTNDKGGVLGRRLELVAEDDRSEPATAARIYEKLITQSKVDAVLGPYSSPITEAVADVTEKHRMAMVAPAAAATSLFKKGGSSSSCWSPRPRSTSRG